MKTMLKLVVLCGMLSSGLAGEEPELSSNAFVIRAKTNAVEQSRNTNAVTVFNPRLAYESLALSIRDKEAKIAEWKKEQARHDVVVKRNNLLGKKTHLAMRGGKLGGYLFDPKAEKMAAHIRALEGQIDFAKNEQKGLLLKYPNLFAMPRTNSVARAR